MFAARGLTRLTGDPHETEDAHARPGSDASAAVGARLQTGCCKQKSAHVMSGDAMSRSTARHVKDSVAGVTHVGRSEVLGIRRGTHRRSPMHTFLRSCSALGSFVVLKLEQKQDRVRKIKGSKQVGLRGPASESG